MQNINNRGNWLGVVGKGQNVRGFMGTLYSAQFSYKLKTA